LVGAMLWWAVFSGQYDDPDTASQSILLDDDRTVRHISLKGNKYGSL
jgi:cbb3-type cytochrome oxidase maturation protein